MATTRDELREHLLAVIEAAPELPKDGREHLADVFMSELDAGFRLVPRSEDPQVAANPSPPRFIGPPAYSKWAPMLPLALFLLIPLFFIGFHAPFLFLGVLLLFVRFAHPWGRRRTALR